MPIALYLHGFASSPSSQKVIEIRRRLEPEGLEFEVPDLNLPSFSRLSFRAIVDSLTSRPDFRPDLIVASSMGAMVALGCLERRSDWNGDLVFIAPAIAMGRRWSDRLPPGEPADVAVFNHAAGREEPIHRTFFHEMARLEVDAKPPRARVRILMGTDDESIPLDEVRSRWNEWRSSGLAEGSSFREIHGADHRLMDHLDEITAEIRIAAGV